MVKTRLMVAMIAIISVIQSSQFAQTHKEPDVLDKVIDVSGTDLSVREATVQILQKSGLPGGVVEVSDCQIATTRISFSNHPVTVRQALDVTASNSTGHKWRYSDGVIVVTPSTEIPELLQTKIDRFSFSNEGRFSLQAISDMLLATPEATERISSLRLEQSLRFGHIVDARPSEISIKLSNVQLIDALNALATKQKGAIWIYNQNSCKAHTYFDISWITRPQLRSSID